MVHILPPGHSSQFAQVMAKSTLLATIDFVFIVRMKRSVRPG
jgi:hypothetical protein